MLERYRDQLRELCQVHGVRRLELFGSAATGAFDPASSDYDFFVEFHDQPPAGAFKRYMGLKFGLEELLGRSVDLVELAAVTNQFFLRQAVDRAEVYRAA